MTRTSFHDKCVLITISLVFQLSAATALAQTTGFTYQGRLTDGGTPANGNYDLQFALFDSVNGGAPIATQTVPTVAVSAGIFTVQLDFGANAFPGASRFLEISARLSGSGAFPPPLSPRQQITSTPYAVRSLNAATADSVPASGVSAGSGNYVQNQAATPQVADFNISGFGKIGNSLSIDGEGAVVSLSSKANNFAIGVRGISANGVGVYGIGANPGSVAVHASGTSWFGGDTTPLSSSFNTGSGTGIAIGSLSSANLGYIFAYDYSVNQPRTLVLNHPGGNVGIGTTTPQARLDVNGTALFQGGATVTGTNGDGAVLTARRPTGDPFVIIDATTVAQNSVLAFRKNNFNRWLLYADSSTESGGNAGSDFKLDAYNNAGGIANHLFVTRATGNVGIGTTTPSEKLSVNGKLRLDQIDSGFGAGTVQLCRNAANVIAVCTSSSLRYKQQIAPFSGGLDLIRRLRPISFTWKMDGSRDLGLGAEDVAKVEPLLVTHNDKGEIEGVRYDRLNVVLINAIKQQQAQIEQQRELIERQQGLASRQQQQLNALKQLACRSHRRARVCR